MKQQTDIDKQRQREAGGEKHKNICLADMFWCSKMNWIADCWFIDPFTKVIIGASDLYI